MVGSLFHPRSCYVAARACYCKPAGAWILQAASAAVDCPWRGEILAVPVAGKSLHNRAQEVIVTCTGSNWAVCKSAAWDGAQKTN